MDWMVILTRGIVLVMYLAVFVYASMTLRIVTGNWTRRATLYTFMAISAYWVVFMGTLLVRGVMIGESFSGWSGAAAIDLFARFGHYIAAGGMWTIVGFLRTVALKYDIVSIKRPS